MAPPYGDHQMKVMHAALAIALGLVPSLAFAGGIYSDALTDAVSGSSSSGGVYSDAVSDAVGGGSSSGGVYSDPLNDAITGPDVIYSPGLIDALTDDDDISPAHGGGSNAGGRYQQQQPQVASLKCFVMGTPSAYPDDLRIRNASVVALPAGTELKWQVRATGDVGHAVLDRSLRPGQTLRLSGVLEEGAEAGTACSAKVI